MTRQRMPGHAAHWIDAWNRRDVDAVLRPFAEDARSVSPKAAGIVGTTVPEGKAAIGDHRRRALERIGAPGFRPGHVTCDVERRGMVVFHEAVLGGAAARACGPMRFDAEGRQVAGEALYGAPIG